MFPTWKENRPFALGLLILIAYGVVFLGAKTHQAIQQTMRLDKPVPYEHTINVEGVGKVLGRPDIATISFGVETRGKDVASAQDRNSKSMNTLIDKMKALEIVADDVQTSSYNAYQETSYNPQTGKSEPGEWIVSQQVNVKVRNTDKISNVIQVAGQNGATNISGPNFTIDDPSSLKDEARAEALADSMKRAGMIAEQLGLRLERVVGYTEYATDAATYYAYDKMSSGMGGGGPVIQPGTNEVMLTVNVTYKLRD